MAIILKKRKLKIDVADIYDVFVHHSNKFAAYVCNRGGLYIEQLENSEKYAALCPCGEDHVCFRR
jgi:hypothetical protein